MCYIYLRTGYCCATTPPADPFRGGFMSEIINSHSRENYKYEYIQSETLNSYI